ncbi:hypothetical protein GIB67_014801, partial [Kingdonia uniflora]
VSGKLNSVGDQYSVKAVENFIGTLTKLEADLLSKDLKNSVANIDETKNIGIILAHGFGGGVFSGRHVMGVLARQVGCEAQIRGIVLIGVSLSREVVPAFAKILLRTSLGKKYLVRPLLRTEITQVFNRRSWYDATKLTTEVLNLYKPANDWSLKSIKKFTFSANLFIKQSGPLCVEGWDEALHKIGRLSSESFLLTQKADLLLKSLEDLPVLVVVGVEDVLVSLKSFQVMASKLANFASLTALQGPVLAKVHQRINPWIRQIIRVYKGKEHVDVEFAIGPIPVDDERRKEIATLISTTMKTNKTFYTDYNGKDFIKRIHDYRTDWDLQVKKLVAENYYPIFFGYK